MTMRHFYPSSIIIALTLAATGCNAFAGAGSSNGVNGASQGLGATAAEGFQPAVGNRRESARAGAGIENTPKPDAPLVIPAEKVDSVEPGALLDVWLNDEASDLRTVSSERSLGTAVARGDFFLYNSVNSDPDLRSLWGESLLLKWSALVEITERGPHVFGTEFSKDQGWGTLRVRTLVRVDDETVFERTARGFGQTEFSTTGSRVLTLAPGFHRLEVWIAAYSSRSLPPDTQLGTFLRIRAPGMMTAEPLQLSQVWHRVR